MALLAPAPTQQSSSVLAKATAAAVPPFRPFDIKEVHSEDPRRLPRPPPPRPLLLLLSLPLCDAQRKAPSVKSELGVRTGLRAAVRPARPPAAAAAELWARARERGERSAVKAFSLLSCLQGRGPPPPLPSPLLLCWPTVHFRSSCTHTISPTTAMEWVGTDSLAPSPAVAPLRDREEGEEG